MARLSISSGRDFLRPLSLLLLALLVSACGGDREDLPGQEVAYPRDGELRLNHLQVIGSHNSYHIEPEPELFTVMRRRLGTIIDGLAYTHPPLDVQFATQGVRQLELDVFADPEGGVLANRAGMAFIRQPIASGLPELDEPGFKVLHIQDIDFGTTCLSFVECLRVVKGWSDANPRHLPIMILVEAKDEPYPLFAGAAPVVPMSAALFDDLDAEIRSVFPPSQLLTPDDVRGDRATLEEAVLTVGWPTLGEVRGRVMFGLDNGGSYRAMYEEGHPSLRGRVMFTSADPGSPEAAFLKLNDSIGSFATIQEMVARGYVVRTRADGDTEEARSGDTRRRDAALASGAQWVSTDYPVPDLRWGVEPPYVATIPGGTPARCNPISAPAACESLDLENPLFLAAE